MVLLREGTDTSQGNPQLLSNISACLAIAQTLASTLGPRGMDKLIVNERGEAQITNDGATILKLLEIVHPAARTLVDIGRAQDAEVGDGTTSVVLLAAQLLKEIRGFIEDGVSPHIIMKGFRQATKLVCSVFSQTPLSLLTSGRLLTRSRSFKSLSTSRILSEWVALTRRPPSSHASHQEIPFFAPQVCIYFHVIKAHTFREAFLLEYGRRGDRNS